MESSTIQISNLDVGVTDQRLEEIFGDFGPIKRCFAVRPKKAQATITKGIVQFAFSEDVDRLLQDTNGEINNEDGSKFAFTRIPDVKQKNEGLKSAEQQKFDREAAHKKKARLIVRNLSFKATDDKIKSYFTTHGTVVDVNILKKKDGKMLGCAFVQYSDVKEAANAIKDFNGKKFLQRPIAIDWAVPKKEFQEKNASGDFESEPNTEVEKEKESDDEEKEEQKANDNDDDQGDDSDNENDSNEDEDEEGDENDSDSQDDGESEDEKDINEPTAKKLKWDKGHDINENKTVFVRNISFNADEEDLRIMMDQNFGKVIFAKFVIDKATEHPKGTAFVKFAEVESVQMCINAAESSDGLWLDDRQMYAVEALRPDEAKVKQEEKKPFKNEKKDSRNLYLSREGIVREGTQAAIGVSKTDLELRVKLEKRKKEMLKDLNRFISPNRLCIRNMPENIDDVQLKKLIKKHVKMSGLKLTEVRVMKDLKSGKSKGFGFVCFTDPAMALATLRALNNNPEPFSNQQRPIVEFSIENKKALNARQKRMEKSREKNPNFNKSGDKKRPTKSNQKFGKVAETDSVPDEKPRFSGSQSKPGQTQLPTHTGPKIRHRGPKISRKDLKKREKLMKNPKKRQAIKESFVDAQKELNGNGVSKPVKAKDAKKDKKSRKKASKAQMKDVKDDKALSKMISDYKQKFVSQNSSAKKRKWFDAS